MKLWQLALICAVVFLVCFLVDSLLKRLRPASRHKKGEQAVRPHRLCSVAGVILLVFPVLFLLGNGIPEEKPVLYIAGCAASFLMGIVLLGYYFSFAVYFNEETFSLTRWGKPCGTFSYAQIRGQRSLMTRSGIHTILFAADTEIELTTTNQNVQAFLQKAFYRWCAEKGIDPDSVENNPRMMTWFPDPDEDA